MNKKGNGVRVLVILSSIGLSVLIFIGFYLAMGNIPSLSESQKVEIGAEIGELSKSAQLRLILEKTADDIANEDYSEVGTLVGQIFGSEAKYSLSINNNRVSGSTISGKTISLDTKLPRYDQEVLSVKLEVAS